MPKTEEKWYLVPEIEVRVHESWINLVQYCQENIPFGDLTIKVANGQPTKRLKEVPSIRFDKQAALMKDGKWYVIPSIDVRVHEYWINMVQWCQNYFISGTLSFRLVGGQPTDLLKAEQEVNFSRPKTIPNGIPLNFTKA